MKRLSEHFDKWRLDALKKAKGFRHKRFKTAKAYWEGFAHASAYAMTIAASQELLDAKEKK